MTLAGDRLAAAQRAGLVNLNRVYQPLAVAVEAAVLRYATPDQHRILRLTDATKMLALFEIDRLLRQARPALVGAIVGAVHQAISAAEFGVNPIPAPDRTVMAFQVANQANASLQTVQPGVVRQTGSLLERGIVAGAAARAVAKTIRQYFFLADRFTGIIQFYPGRANMASERARTVLLTETTRAHGRTMINRAIRDGDLLRYHVSHKHLEIDECDRLERQDVGFGPGIYPPDDFPTVPRHVNCRCWAEPADRPRFLALSESVPA